MVVVLHALAPDRRSPHSNMYVDPFLPLISTPKYFGLRLVKVAEKEVGLLGQMSRTVCRSRVTVKPGFYLPSQTPAGPLSGPSSTQARASSFVEASGRRGQPADRLPVSHDQIWANLAVRGRSASSFLLTIATAASTRDDLAVLLA